MSTGIRGLRAQELVLVFLFLAMALVTPEHDPSEIALILLLGALQITELRFIRIETARGNLLWNLGKLIAGWVLIGYTGGISSSYYWVLLFPVISAAGTLSVIGTLLFTGFACGAYLSFLLGVDWNQVDIHPEAYAEIARRGIFLGISGLLVNRLARALREQSLRHKALADELADTNRNLQAAEAQVRRGERLAALGQLTAGLAHELRNPLGTIKASADMLHQNLPEKDEIAKELAGYISCEVDRTNSLVSRFLDFARPLEIRRAEADLGAVILRSVNDFRREQNGRGVTVVPGLPPEPIVFPFDAELMERVFLNLVMNAGQASPEGGEVRIQALRRGNDAVIRVSDRGSGVKPEHLETIFNPFFTTKASGTGLGLAIVAKIVDEHGGRVHVESTPDQGTTFTVTLPMMEKEHE